MRCCKSLQDNLGFASKTSAKIPAANGADADVPECLEKRWEKEKKNKTNFEVSMNFEVDST